MLSYSTFIYCNIRNHHVDSNYVIGGVAWTLPMSAIARPTGLSFQADLRREMNDPLVASQPRQRVAVATRRLKAKCVEFIPPGRVIMCCHDLEE